MSVIARIGRRSATSTCVESITEAEWESLQAQCHDADVRQTTAFARATAARHGASVETVRIRAGAEVIGGACVRVRRAPLIGGIAYVAGGPLVHGTADSPDEANRRAQCLAALRSEYATRRGLLLRVRPRAPVPGSESFTREALQRAGFVVNGGTERTILLDLARSTDELRAGLRQKWRNGLHRAEREVDDGRCTVEAGSGDDLMSDFARLHEHLLLRKGFTAELDAAFYACVQRSLPPSSRLHVHIVRIGRQPVAGHLAAYGGGRMLYVLGASTPAGHTVRAPYLLQWRAIEEARRRGTRWYDLGGIDPEGNAGVCHFKRGLGGAEVEEIGCAEAARSAVSAHLVREGERIFRALRRAG